MILVLLDWFEVQCLVKSISDNVLLNLQCCIRSVELSKVFKPPVDLVFCYERVGFIVNMSVHSRAMGSSIVPPCESVWLLIEVDLAAPDFCLACPELYQAVGRHGRWSWENPTCSFRHLEWIDESWCKVPIVQWFPGNIKSPILTSFQNTRHTSLLPSNIVVGFHALSCSWQSSRSRTKTIFFSMPLIPSLFDL